MLGSIPPSNIVSLFQKSHVISASIKCVTVKSQFTYSFFQLMKVNLEQFLSSLCVQTLSFSVIQFLLNRLVALLREKVCLLIT